MKLYYSPGACSLASHIALNEANAPYTPMPIDLAKGESMTPQFLGLNPMGSVPVLEIDANHALTEGVAIMEYVAAKYPQAKLRPLVDSPEYFQFRKWMNFIATEVHKNFSTLWGLDGMTANPAAQNDIKNFTLANLQSVFGVLDQHLVKNEYLCGSQYTVADGYLFTIMRWCGYMKVDYAQHKYLAAYLARIGERPAILKTLKLEHN